LVEPPTCLLESHVYFRLLLGMARLSGAVFGLALGWLALQEVAANEPLSPEALTADDECQVGEDGQCALNELQLRGDRAAAARVAEAQEEEQECYDAVPGDACWRAIMWAKHDGIHGHPDWYPGLTAHSAESEFQDIVHKHTPQKCAKPCGTAGAAASRHSHSHGGTVGASAHAVGSSGFVTNRGTKSFSWTKRTKGTAAALALALQGWPKPFGLSMKATVEFIDGDLLKTSPFGSDGVILPWPEAGNDQLGDGGWVGYTRRQVCYITAQTFLGATTPGYSSGLARLMKMCPGTGNFREAFAYLLAACAADPTLKDGEQGPLLVAAKAFAAPTVPEVRAAAAGVSLEGADLRVCDYDSGAPPMPGVTKVPGAGCSPRSDSTVGRDFMTGGLEGQATQDISAAWFGGYLFDAHACGLGGGQDERLSVYFPEVTVLAYFLSSSHPFPQLRQPVWVLGARNFFTGLDGTARFDHPLRLADVPFTSDLKSVKIASKSYKISSSRPFLVFMSENQGYMGGDNSPKLPVARRNRLAEQRDVGHGRFSFEKQVRAWYRSVALTSYSPDVRPALKALVSSIGAGPWLAGLWWGDSQTGFLAVWLGQAIAAPTWGKPLPLDYYMYSSFTENPGNQCFVHAKKACQACMAKCQSPSPTRRSFYLPQAAYMQPGKPCVTSYKDCGNVGLAQIVKHFGGDTAGELWATIEQKLKKSDLSQTIFEELMSKK